MFKILYDLDDLDNVEKNLIAEASNRLDVGEFQLFQLGFEEWFDKEPTPEALENIFFVYLYRDEIPPWARHYARRIIAEDDRGALRPADPSYHRFDAESMVRVDRASGLFKIILLAVIVAAALAVSIYVLDGVIPADKPCQFPPCPWVS